MKKLSFFYLITALIIFSCKEKNSVNTDKDQYDIYSKVIDKSTGLGNKPWYEDSEKLNRIPIKDSIQYHKYFDSLKDYFRKNFFYMIINDSTIDITDEMYKLKYGIENNHLFLKDYLDGDSSFVSFILEWQPSKFLKQKIYTHKLKQDFQYKISLKKSKDSNDLLIGKVTMSNIIFNKTHTLGIVYIVNGGGAVYFLEKKISTGWNIKGSIVLWQS